MTALFLKTFEVVQEITRRMLSGEFDVQTYFGEIDLEADSYVIIVEEISIKIIVNRNHSKAFINDDFLFSNSIYGSFILDETNEKVLYMQLMKVLNKKQEQIRRKNA